MSFRNLCLFFILFVCLNFIAVSSYPQQYNFYNYSIEDGLPQSVVTTICEDRRGNLWLGTSGGGLCKYNGHEFIQYSEKDGLGGAIVTSIVEDHKGNIWIGSTWGGLTKFNGAEFKNYTVSDGLLANAVQCLLIDEKGNLWIGTENGLSKQTANLKGKAKELFINYTDNDGLIGNDIICITQDLNKSILIGTDNGISLYDGKTFMDLSLEDGINLEIVVSILVDSQGNIWTSSDNEEINCFRVQDGKLKDLYLEKGISNPINYTFALNHLQGQYINYIFQDSYQNLWFSTSDQGVFKYIIPSSNLGKSKLLHFTKKQGMPTNKIEVINEDRSGNIWFGTSGKGVIKYRGEVFMHISENDGLLDDDVFSLAQDHKGNVWIGGLASGVAKFDGKNISTYTMKDGLLHNRVRGILCDSKGNVWLATSGGVNKISSEDIANNIFKVSDITYNEGLVSNSVRSLMEDRDGNIWFGTSSGVSIYDGESLITPDFNGDFRHHNIHSIIEGNNSDIWFGTGGGLSKYDGQKVENYYENICNGSIEAILEDSKGNIWIGTQRCVALFDGKDFYAITEDDGLSSNTIYLMVFDTQGKLIVGTNKGIDVITFLEDQEVDNETLVLREIQTNKSNIKIINIKHYGKLEGFNAIECNAGAVCVDSDGSIWFGTVNGVTKYNPNIEKFNDQEPITSILNIRLFLKNRDSLYYEDSLGNAFSLNQGIKLRHNHNHLTFDFAGVSLTIPEKVLYQYMLEGFDNDWSPVSKERFATYSNIPPGSFTFKVKACNEEGIWNQVPASYSFVIMPPYWQTWWFYSLCVIFGLGSIFSIYWIRIGQLRKESMHKTDVINAIVEAQEKERKRIAAELHDGIGSMLSSVRLNLSSIESKKNNLAEKKQKAFSNSLSMLDDACSELRIISHNMMPGALVELGLFDALEEYFSKLEDTAQFKINFQVTNIDKRLNGNIEIILYRVIQEIFNNIIKHAQARKVDVHIFKLRNIIKIFIKDDGSGFDVVTVTRRGIGLGNIESRIEYLNGIVNFDSQIGKGTTVNIEIPT